jgi:hypothetical protein
VHQGAKLAIPRRPEPWIHALTNAMPTLQVKCLVGCIFHNFGNRSANNYVKTSATCVKADTQYDYSSLAISWM